MIGLLANTGSLTEQLQKIPWMGWVVIAAIGSFIALMLVIQFIKSFLHLCPPNEVLIFYGKNRRLAHGSSVPPPVRPGARVALPPPPPDVRRNTLGGAPRPPVPRPVQKRIG